MFFTFAPYFHLVLTHMFTKDKPKFYINTLEELKTFPFEGGASVRCDMFYEYFYHYGWLVIESIFKFWSNRIFEY